MNSKQQYFVSAIGTDSGKTFFSAILAQKLQAHYWKPIQAGYPTDRETVASITTGVNFLPERYLLKKPASPHDAAAEEGIHIQSQDFELPKVDGPLVIEGAGGMLVPINDHENVIDLAAKWPVEIILVANLYLGSINHTLLSVAYLKQRNLPVKGIVFNGPANKASEEVILKRSGYPCLLRIAPEKEVNIETVLRYANQLEL